MTHRRVIINADDLGISEATNLAIRDAFLDGILTSASLMANGPAFEHAIEHVVRPYPDLGIGLHFCLTGGRCVSAPGRIPSLVNHAGMLRHGFVSLLRLTIRQPAVAMRHIHRELNAQYSRLEDAGVSIDHIDSHRHIHAIPLIGRIVRRKARESGCGVRLPREPMTFRPSATWLRNVPKQLILNTLLYFNRDPAGHDHLVPGADRTYGILDSGCVELPALGRILQHLPVGTAEVITHPATQASTPADPSLAAGDRKFLMRPERQAELSALRDVRIRNLVATRGIILSRYSDLPTSRA